jgi:hypothetical protein
VAPNDHRVQGSIGTSGDAGPIRVMIYVEVDDLSENLAYADELGRQRNL